MIRIPIIHFGSNHCTCRYRNHEILALSIEPLVIATCICSSRHLDAKVYCLAIDGYLFYVCRLNARICIGAIALTKLPCYCCFLRNIKLRYAVLFKLRCQSGILAELVCLTNSIGIIATSPTLQSVTLLIQCLISRNCHAESTISVLSGRHFTVCSAIALVKADCCKSLEVCSNRSIGTERIDGICCICAKDCILVIVICPVNESIASIRCCREGD